MSADGPTPTSWRQRWLCADGHVMKLQTALDPAGSRRGHRTANGVLYGRPNGTPPVTVCTGFRYTLPSRLLLRVSTNDTGPSTSSITATSPGAPTCSVPSFGWRLITLAGLAVAMVTTCSSEKPSPMNLLITHGRYGMPRRLAGDHVH